MGQNHNISADGFGTGIPWGRMTNMIHATKPLCEIMQLYSTTRFKLVVWTNLVWKSLKRSHADKEFLDNSIDFDRSFMRIQQPLWYPSVFDAVMSTVCFMSATNHLAILQRWTQLMVWTVIKSAHKRDKLVLHLHSIGTDGWQFVTYGPAKCCARWGYTCRLAYRARGSTRDFCSLPWLSR